MGGTELDHFLCCHENWSDCVLSRSPLSNGRPLLSRGQFNDIILQPHLNVKPQQVKSLSVCWFREQAKTADKHTSIYWKFYLFMPLILLWYCSSFSPVETDCICCNYSIHQCFWDTVTFFKAWFHVLKKTNRCSCFSSRVQQSQGLLDPNPMTATTCRTSCIRAPHMSSPATKTPRRALM